MASDHARKREASQGESCATDWLSDEENCSVRTDLTTIPTSNVRRVSLSPDPKTKTKTMSYSSADQELHDLCRSLLDSAGDDSSKRIAVASALNNYYFNDKPFFDRICEHHGVFIDNEDITKLDALTETQKVTFSRILGGQMVQILVGTMSFQEMSTHSTRSGNNMSSTESSLTTSINDGTTAIIPRVDSSSNLARLAVAGSSDESSGSQLTTNIGYHISADDSSGQSGIGENPKH